MPDEILRTFIAIELDESLRLALKSVEDKFKRQTPPGTVRWVLPDGIHLTLKFLGDTPRSRLPEVEAGLRSACGDLVSFEFSVEGRGCFPNFRRPRVIWVAARDKRQNLIRLNLAIEREIAPLGWPTEDRAFSPHLTLGRVTRNADPRAEAAIGQAVERSVIEQIGTQRVTAVSLIESVLQPSGAVYTTLLSIPLAGTGREGD
jgi:RNA 2',3'-cyclic 3'-phosphodiesterase